MAQGVDAPALGDARTLAGARIGALGRLDAQGLFAAGVAKQP